MYLKGCPSIITFGFTDINVTTMYDSSFPNKGRLGPSHLPLLVLDRFKRGLISRTS